jgi:diguanylate cyclase (GGDEF)-like protein
MRPRRWTTPSSRTGASPDVRQNTLSYAIVSRSPAARGRSAGQAATVAEKIRTLLAEPDILTLRHRGSPSLTVEHHCSSSIGVVLFQGRAASAEEVLKDADIAMYRAKTDGRDRVRFYEP